MNDNASGLCCGIFVAPLEEPGYLVASVRYSFGEIGQEVSTPMAGIIIPVPAVAVILAMVNDVEAWVADGQVHGFPQPFYCGEVNHCQILYSVATDRYSVGLGLVAGYFSSLAPLREPLEEMLAQIHENSPWPVSAPEWLQRFAKQLEC